MAIRLIVSLMIIFLFPAFTRADELIARLIKAEMKLAEWKRYSKEVDEQYNQPQPQPPVYQQPMYQQPMYQPSGGFFGGGRRGFFGGRGCSGST